MKKVFLVIAVLLLSGSCLYGSILFDSPKTIYSCASGGYGIRLAVVSGDQPGIVYCHQYAMVARYTGDLGVTRTTVSASSWNKFEPNIAVDANGDVHAVWADGSSGWTIQYRGQSGGVWDASVTDLATSSVGKPFMSVSAAADGGIDVLWSGPTVSNDVYYMHKSSAGVWSTPVTIGSGYRIYPRMLSDATDRYLVYHVQGDANYLVGLEGPRYCLESESFASSYQIPVSYQTSTGMGRVNTGDAMTDLVWNGSVLDLAVVGDPVRDATNVTTGAIYLYQDILGGASNRVTVFDDHTASTDGTASWVDLAIDPDGNYYVFFVAKADGSDNQCLYMQEVAPDGTLVGARQALVEELRIEHVDAEWGVDCVHVCYQTEDASNYARYEYLTNAPASEPVFSHIGKYISGPTDITITSLTASADIYYTIDGSEPTTASLLYNGPVTVNDGTTLKAIAVASGYSNSSVTSVSYVVPAAFNDPQTIPSGTAVVDGDLSDWSGASWTALDQPYDLTGSTQAALDADVPEAYYAARWQSGKVYVAVKVRDTSHSFTDSYTDWQARDAIEVYIHTDNNDDPLYVDAITAQQYTVGVKNSNPSEVWTTIGGNFAYYGLTGNDFFGSGLAVAGISGEWINYELELTPFTYLGVRATGDLSTSIVTQLDVNEVIGLDVCVAAHNGSSYAGMKSENMMTGKCGNWEAFGLHVLVDRLPGDANGDGAVDVGDLGILAANYGTTTGATWSLGDFNGDGAVDVGDLGILAANYGAGSSSNFDADYAKIFGEDAAEKTAADSSVCSLIGLPLIIGLLIAGLMIVRFKD